MKLKNSYFYTYREDVKDEDSISSNLLVKAGMMKKVGAGIYYFTPMGFKTMDNIKKVVKEEMDLAGAQELLMPSLIPSEVYETCGRVEAFGKDMFHLNDRFERPMVLGPTHEELFTMAAKNMVKSYKDLPFTIYQIADKFRDEPRPRYGLIRVREFLMKDAYSFDKDDISLNQSYQKMFDAYKRIFDRLGIDYKIVRSSTGAMGGSLSEEFQAVTEVGEDTLVLCDSCDYASNLEISTCRKVEEKEETKEKELVETPHMESIEEVASFLSISPKKTVKALLMDVNHELVVFFLRGDRDLNLEKACKLLNVKEITFASDELIEGSNAVPGYTGPIDLKAKIVVDEEVLHMKNFVVGANKSGYHYKNVNVSDFKYDVKGDISNVVEGDLCPNCGGHLYFKKGIEIGNTFKLGTKYAEKLGLTYLDENNKEQVVTMGCYGIGLGRILASIIEQNHDEKGMLLPVEVSPYKVCIVPTNTKDEKVMECADRIYDMLTQNGMEPLLDDRDERPGVKFNDMDLIGIPYRITIGKKYLETGMLEVKGRSEEESTLISYDQLLEHIKELMK